MTPLQPDLRISITLDAQQWNTVLGALNEVPHRIARPVIDAIMPQVQAAAEKAEAQAAAPPPTAKPNGGAEAHVSD